MSTTEPASGNERSYDLYLSAGLSFHWSNPNHGVTLADARIIWTIDGETQEAKLASIVQIRLQTGGNAQDVVAMCLVSFADGYVLTVYNSSAQGLPDSGQAAIYREFVRDLHRRLAVAKVPVDCVAGYTEGRYQVVLVSGVLLGLIVVVLPFVLLLVTGEAKALYLLGAGIFLFWPLYRMVQANKPHRYDPADLPEDLLL